MARRHRAAAAAAARVHWGGRRHTYVMDHVTKRIIGDMPAASADEPYAVFYADAVADEIVRAVKG